MKGTDTIFFVDKSDIQADLWKDVTHGSIVVSYRPENLTPIAHASQWAAIELIALGIVEHQPHIYSRSSSFLTAQSPRQVLAS